MTCVLVTGATGNVGREVARACVERGHHVRAAGRGGAEAGVGGTGGVPGGEAVRLDLLDRATWPAALAGCDSVFLLRPPAIADVRGSLLPFVDTARAAGVRHVVFLSVAGAERMRWVPHRAVEEHLIRGPRGFTILRPGFFAQNLGDAYRRDLIEDGRLFVPAGRGRVAFLDVRDVGDMAARVLEEPRRFEGAAITLTGPEALTFDDVARVLSDELGRPIRYEPASVIAYAAHLARRRGLPWAQIAVQTVLHLGLRRGDAEAVSPSVEEILGRPASPLRGYVARARDLWRLPGGASAP